MNILSLFDGISMAKVALDKANIPVNMYLASEIDKYAIQVSKKNYSDIIHLGDVRYIKKVKVPIDLLIGGSPCTNLSIAGDGTGLEGEQSKLFFEYIRLLSTVKPKYFILENVASMRKVHKDEMSYIIGFQPVMLDAALVSAQSRKRLFWVGKLNNKGIYEKVEIEQPIDRGIKLSDILLEHTYTEYIKSYPLTASYDGAVLWNSISKCQRTMVWNKPIRVDTLGKGGQGERVYSIDGKSVCLAANGGGKGAKTGLYAIKDYARKLHPIECERLMGVVDNYTDGISDTQRYKCLGNGFHVDIISHILNQIFNPNEYNGKDGLNYQSEIRKEWD